MRRPKNYITLVLLLVLLTSTSISFARENFEMEEFIFVADSVEDDETVEIASEEEEKTLEQLQRESQLEENLLFLKRIEDEYEYARGTFNQISEVVKDAKIRLKDVHSQSLDLKSQLYYLDNVTDKSYKKLISVTKQLMEKQNALDLLENDLKEKEDLMRQQKNFIAEYLRLSYIQEKTYFPMDDHEMASIPFFLADTSVASLINETDYFDILHESAIGFMKEIADIEKEIVRLKNSFEEDKSQILQLNETLEVEQLQLNAQKQAKVKLLAETESHEEIFLELVKKSREEKEEARKELLVLKENLDIIRKKIDEMGANFNPSEYQSLLDKTSREVYEFYLSSANNETVSKMLWPVIPSKEKGISAFFRDPTYPFGVHNAIDIPVPNRTVVRAPLSCVVYKTKDNGFGYSYMSLACKGGLMLTFGHISEFLVKEGEKVNIGDRIALSGGVPGTKGAGLLTTGAHLHFEVLKDGKYRDPLDYLDIALLDYDKLPEKYKKRIKERVKRKTDSKIIFEPSYLR